MWFIIEESPPSPIISRSVDCGDQWHVLSNLSSRPTHPPTHTDFITATGSPSLTGVEPVAGLLPHLPGVLVAWPAHHTSCCSTTLTTQAVLTCEHVGPPTTRGCLSSSSSSLWSDLKARLCVCRQPPPSLQTLPGSRGGASQCLRWIWGGGRTRGIFGEWGNGTWSDNLFCLLPSRTKNMLLAEHPQGTMWKTLGFFS